MLVHFGCVEKYHNDKDKKVVVVDYVLCFDQKY